MQAKSLGKDPNESDDQGLERHITATRRQNFLVPPRRHRSFPLLELADPENRPRASARASAAKTAKTAKAADPPAPAASPSASGSGGGVAAGGNR